MMDQREGYGLARPAVQVPAKGISQDRLQARLVKTTAGTSGLSTIDGKTPADGDYILLATGGTPGADGLYRAAAGAWKQIARLNYAQSGSAPVYPHGSLITVWDGSAPPRIFVTGVSGVATF